MFRFLQHNKYPILLLCIFLAAESIVHPFGNYPLNDDWSYGKSVLVLLKEGNIFIGSWCAMTLASHVVWGFLFVKVFGFSFVVLRFSTMVSTLIGIWILFRLSHELSKRKAVAFIICLAVMFNPMYFNLSNTFMTDVNFNTWMLVCVWWAFRFFKSNQFIYLIGVFVMSLVLILNRQFGLVLPVAFAFACLFFKWKQPKVLVSVLLGVLFTYAGFKLYEQYLLHSIPTWSAYKFSGKVNVLDVEFFKAFWFLFKIRIMVILLMLLVYTSPFFLMVLPNYYRTLPKRKFFTKAILALALTACFFKTELLQGNVFTNMLLGAETFHDLKEGHTFSAFFQQLVDVLKLVLAFVSILGVLSAVSVRKKAIANTQNQAFNCFVVLFIGMYIILMFVSYSTFDRYLIPVISLLYILYVSIFTAPKIAMVPAIMVLTVFFYVSVFGTKDYMTMNDAKWQAVKELKENHHVSNDRLNAGFEIMCWNDGVYTWWADYLSLEYADYLIQYNPSKGYKKINTVYFQRYFPYTRDSISVFERE